MNDASVIYLDSGSNNLFIFFSKGYDKFKFWLRFKQPSPMLSNILRLLTI